MSPANRIERLEPFDVGPGCNYSRGRPGPRSTIPPDLAAFNCSNERALEQKRLIHPQQEVARRERFCHEEIRASSQRSSYVRRQARSAENYYFGAGKTGI